VNGKHDTEQLALSLDSFITRYVLCARCRNPETDLKVKGETITSRCKACGKTSNIDMSHKLSSYVLKNPPVDKEAKAAAPAQARPTKGQPTKTPQKPVQAEEEVEWSVDTSPAAVEQRRRELLGNRDRLSQKDGEADEEEKPKTEGFELDTQNPVPSLTKYFATYPDPEECVNQVKILSTKLQFSDTTLMKTIFASLFTHDTIRKDFYKKTEILALFCTNTKHQKIVLYCIEKLVEHDKKLLPQLPHLLNGFFEERILDQDTIVKWYKNPMKKTDAKFSKDMRDRSKQFVEWLENTPDEESEDSF